MSRSPQTERNKYIYAGQGFVMSTQDNRVSAQKKLGWLLLLSTYPLLSIFCLIFKHNMTVSTIRQALLSFAPLNSKIETDSSEWRDMLQNCSTGTGVTDP